MANRNKKIKCLGKIAIIFLAFCMLIPQNAVSSFAGTEDAAAAAEAELLNETTEDTDAVSAEPEAEAADAEEAVTPDIVAPNEADRSGSKDDTTAAEASAAVTFDQTIEDEKGEDGETLPEIKVTVTAAEGSFPAGTAMKAEYADLDETRDLMIDDLKKIIIPAAAVNITFYDKNGDEVQPSSEVNVKFEADFIEKDKDAVVVHIDDEGKCEEKDVSEQEEGMLSIEAEDFSVYAVGYTVDFIFDGLQYSIAGESSVKLSTILEKLETGLYTDLIKAVSFSDETLVKVEKDETSDDDDTPDWTLTSLKPFDTEETLTLTLKDDSVVTIKVTDAIEYSGKSGSVTWTIDADGNMVFKPTSGTSGTLADCKSETGQSWNAYKSYIKTISFEGTVKANTNSYYLFADLPNLTSFNANGFDFSGAGGIDGLFMNDTSLETLDLSGLDTSSVVYARGVFWGCNALKTLDVSTWNTSKVKETIAAFYNCSKLENLDLSGWDMSENTNMNAMFRECKSLTSLDLLGWNTAKVTNMSLMFMDCSNLKDIDVSSFDTSKTTDMCAMFRGCGSLTSLDVSGYDTSKVTDMGSMFYGCSGLTNIDVGNFDTSKTQYMDFMFYGCTGLTSIDVSSFDTSKVKSMAEMFNRCVLLKSIDVSNFKTSNVTNMRYMFGMCYAAEEILFGEDFNTSKAGDMSNMFLDCTSLKELDLSMMAQTGKLTKAANMFSMCTSLKKLNIAGLDITNVEYFWDFFHDCNAVEEITIGDGFRFPNAGTDNNQDTGFLRGTWLRDTDNTVYTSTELVQLLRARSMPGTYTRVTEHSIDVQFPATYVINKVTDWELISDSDRFIKDGDRVYTKIDIDETGTADPYEMDEGFALLFKGNVEDVNGNKYNLRLDFSNIKLYRHDFTQEYDLGDEYYHMFFRLADDGIICIRGEDRLSSDLTDDEDIAYSSVYETNTWQDIKITIVDDEGIEQEGTFIFSIYDLDIPSSLDKGGTYYQDSNKGYGLNSEGVYLKAGFDTDTITMADYTYLNDFGDTANGYRVHGTQQDGSSESTDLIVQGDASGSVFTWTGQSCENFLFFQYQPKPVHFDKVDQYGKRVDGAEIELYSVEDTADGEIETLLTSWTTDSTSTHDKNLFLLSGKYRIKEKTPPEGYESAEPVTFKVDLDQDVCDENGNKLDNANIVSMTDNVKYGKLKITKDLSDHENVKFGERIDETSFIFSVKVTYKGKTFYDDIVTMVFNEAGSQTVTLGDFPAGATATVEEIYAGGNYEVSGSDTVSVKIKPGSDDDEDIAEAEFTNSHDGGYKGGGSVENTYEKNENGGWTVTPAYSKDN